MIHKILLSCMCLFLFAACSGGSGSIEEVDFTNGAEINGEINGAPFRILVPPAAQWNGTLYIYLPGYRDRTNSAIDAPEDRSVSAAPGGALAEQALLAQGFAIAGTAYRENGWSVELGIDDVRELRTRFVNAVAEPNRVILNGFSMGSVVALASLERNADLYDVVLGMCSVGGGATRNFDLGRDFLLAYDVLFGIPAEWGTLTDLNSDLDFETQVLPVVGAQLQNPANLPAFEFMRLLVGAPSDGFFTGDNPFFFTNMFFATEVTAQLEDRSGGNPTQNLTRTYSLSPEATAGLAAFGFDAGPVLAQMNATRFAADDSARRYLADFADFGGRFSEDDRVLLVHTTVDSFVLPGNTTAYTQLAGSQGRGRFVQTAFTNAVGHCAFTGEQIVTSVLAADFFGENGTIFRDPFFTEERGFNESFVPNPLPAP